MIKVKIYKNDLLEYYEREYEKIQTVMEYLDYKMMSKYIKKGYLYIPQKDYTQEHLDVVLSVLKNNLDEDTRKKDICKSLLEANL